MTKITVVLYLSHECPACQRLVERGIVSGLRAFVKKRLGGVLRIVYVDTDEARQAALGNFIDSIPAIVVGRKVIQGLRPDITLSELKDLITGVAWGSDTHHSKFKLIEAGKATPLIKERLGWR